MSYLHTHNIYICIYIYTTQYLNLLISVLFCSKIQILFASYMPRELKKLRIMLRYPLCLKTIYSWDFSYGCISCLPLRYTNFVRAPIIIPAWISNYIHYKVWDEMIYPYPNLAGAADWHRRRQNRQRIAILKSYLLHDIIHPPSFGSTFEIVRE